MSAMISLIKTSPNLVDVEARHSQYPDTFEIPTITEVLNTSVGDQVKICLEDQVIKGGLTGERIWAKILHIERIKVDELGFVPGYVHTFIVRISNVPVSDNFDYGDIFFISERHVLDIYPVSGGLS